MLAKIYYGVERVSLSNLAKVYVTVEKVCTTLNAMQKEGNFMTGLSIHFSNRKRLESEKV